jgi:hypothetical protein
MLVSLWSKFKQGTRRVGSKTAGHKYVTLFVLFQIFRLHLINKLQKAIILSRV